MPQVMQNPETMDTDNAQELCDDINKNLSLYLPSLSEEVTQLGLTILFQDNKIGIIDRVDFVYNTKGVRQAFIHLNEWFDSTETRELQKKIMDNKQTAIIKCKKMNGHKTNNLIILTNRNHRQLGNSDLLSTLKNRINFLEEQFRKLSPNNTIDNPNKRNRN